MANFILGGAFDCRITERVRQKEGWAYGSGSLIRVDALDDGAQFIAFAFAAPQNADKARKAIGEEIDRLVKDGVDAAELDKAKAAYKANFDGQLASDATVTAILQRSLYFDRPLAFTAQINDKIAKLTPEDIKRVLAKGYLQTAKLVQITAGDLKKAATQK
jgi:zinc protease